MANPRTKWSVIWAVWLTFFAVAETKAIQSKHDCAPLSFHLRHAFGIPRKSRLGRAAFAGITAGLTFHLFKVG